MNSKQDSRMFYLSLTTLIHANYLRTFIGLGVVLVGIAMYRAVVGE